MPTKPAKSLISRRSPQPMWHQLKELLVARIQSGEWRPGDLVPPELELQNAYKLSRTTVRQALRELELDGMVTRYRGRGTFVARPKLTHGPEPHDGLSRSLVEQGLRPSWNLLWHGFAAVPEDEAARLGVAPGSQVYCVRRLRLANDEPLGYHLAWVAPPFTDGIDETALEEGGSLDYLRREGRVHGAHAERILEAVPAGDTEVLLLGVEHGAPLFRIRRLLVASDGTPIESLSAWYRGDRFQYRVGHRE